MLLRARIVLPVAQPPIENGAVLLDGDRIAAIGAWPDLKSAASVPTIDLGEVILLPGFINAHCHLDYTDMGGLLPTRRSFSEWIKSIVTFKATWSYTEFARSWMRGAAMLLGSGTTTVVNIEAVPELLADVADATPLQVIHCLELISIRGDQSPARLVADAVSVLNNLRADNCGLSPHAPYTTSLELLRLAAAAAREHGWLLTTHVAESLEEHDMFAQAQGPMFDWLKPQRNMSDCGQCSPVRHLERAGALGPQMLAVHANYVSLEDAQLLAARRASVVHCPRSHRYFGHQPFPLARLRQAGVNLCLGTDSLATVQKHAGVPLTLDMFAEMRAFAAAFPELAPDDIIAMATLNGARAMNRSAELGSLRVGARANLIAIPSNTGIDAACSAVLEHRGDVSASFIAGQRVFPVRSNAPADAVV